MTQLFDHRGRPIKPAELTKEKAAPSVTGVRTIWNETVAGGLTPTRLANILREAAEGDHNAYLVLAEEMEERDLHYFCELSKRKLAVSRLPVTVEAAGDDQHDIDLADEIRALAAEPGFKALLKDLLDALGKGYSAVEIKWNRSSNRWEPEYEWRDPRFFQFDQVGRSEIRLRDEQDLMEGIELPPAQFITHVPKLKSGIPIRGGFARLAAWAWMCKGYTVKDWLAFAEVFGMPFRMGKYDKTASEDDKAVLRMAVANLGSDAAGVFPKSMDVELLQPSNASGSAQFFKTLADYLDDQVSKGVLGQTASSSGTPGKLGDEKLQAEVRDDIRDDDAEQLAETLNRDLVRLYIDLNYGPQKAYPKLCLQAIEPDDVKAMVDALDKLVPLGLRVEQSVVRDKIGLPDPDKNAKPEDLLGKSAAASGSTDSVENRQQRSCPSCSTALNSEHQPDELDDLADEELGDWQPQIDPLLQPIRRAVADAASLEDLLEKLPTLFDKMDTTALLEALAAAQLKARALGDAGDS